MTFYYPEIQRFTAVISIASLTGYITEYWEISFICLLLLYILWLHMQVNELFIWLQGGAKKKHTPDNSGIWEGVYHQIHQLERKSNKRKKRMSKLLKRFHRIIRGMPYGTLLLNERNEIDWLNKQAEELLHLSLKHDLGQKIGDLLRVPQFQQAIQQDVSQQLIIISPHNPLVHLSVHIIHIKSSLKLLIVDDISEQIQLQTMRSNFIANASHELRTPLTVISGYLEILEDEPLSPSHLNAIQSASEQSRRMQKIIEDLLALSRLEQPIEPETHHQQVNLADVIEHICQDESNLSSHHFHLNLNPQLRVQGAEHELVSLCVNLIHNAVLYTPSGTDIFITWENIKKMACLSIKDTGNGIAEEHINHLTERFYRVDKERSKQSSGTGLGLAIVKHIVQRHNGTLVIHSEIGKGTEFSISFQIMNP